MDYEQPTRKVRVNGTIPLETLYDRLIAAGADIDHHETDLYVKLTPAVATLLDSAGWLWSSFISTNDGKRWAEVAFAYVSKLWAQRQALAKGTQ